MIFHCWHIDKMLFVCLQSDNIWHVHVLASTWSHYLVVNAQTFVDIYSCMIKIHAFKFGTFITMSLVTMKVLELYVALNYAWLLTTHGFKPHVEFNHSWSWTTALTSRGPLLQIRVATTQKFTHVCAVVTGRHCNCYWCSWVETAIDVDKW